MKKIQIIMMALAATLATSCSLDEHPYSITSEQLAQSEAGAKQLVTGIYAIFWDNWPPRSAGCCPPSASPVWTGSPGLM